jgi:hypothetical protein
MDFEYYTLEGDGKGAFSFAHLYYEIDSNGQSDIVSIADNTRVSPSEETQTLCEANEIFKWNKLFQQQFDLPRDSPTTEIDRANGIRECAVIYRFVLHSCISGLRNAL